MKVYALTTHEPLKDRIETFEMLGSPDPGFTPLVYATREIAEIAAKQYNEEWNDPEPATVEEIEVRATP